VGEGGRAARCETGEDVSDLEACACPLCDAEAAGREWHTKSEVRCVTCGHYYVGHEAARLLDEQASRAERAVVGEAMRAHLQALRQFNPGVIPMVLADDVRAAAGRKA
jgi:Zn ribbon nucleic-acid-binding protein